MEHSLPLSVDPGTKEEPDLTASASSSSLRLSNLSSSSRRFRHISPPPSSQLVPQKKGLGASQPQLTSHRPTYPEIFHNTVTVSSSSVVPSDESHRTSAQTPVTQAYKFIALTLTTVRVDDPESIISTLPLDHRLSKLSSLYPIPLTLKPFLLGPREQADSVAACIWTDESGLSLIQEWASSWSGPISLLVTHSAPPSSISYQELYIRLVSLSQLVPNISFHVQHTSSSLHNFNAYINIARLFSPSPKVLLFPPLALTLWGSLPRSSALLQNAVKEAHEQFIIPFSPLRLSNVSSADMSRNEFFLTSALWLDRDISPWCTERLFTIMEETKGGKDHHLASNIEMALHWQECIWNIWLRSHGRIQLLLDEGWNDSGAPSLPLKFDTPPETVESSLRVRLARKQRSETCFLVAREMVALGEWFSVPSQLIALGETTGDSGDSEVKQLQTESSQAIWLKSVCRETLERWGKELISD